jgi:hypothetical protein
VVEVNRARPGERLSPRRIAEALLPKLQKAGGYEKSDFVASQAGRVENQPAWMAARKFIKADQTTIGVVFVWTTPFPRYGLSLHYMVYVQWNGPDVKKALRIASAVFGSIRHTPLLSPSYLDLPTLTGPVVIESELFAIAVPFGWHLRGSTPPAGKSKVVFRAGVMDHICGMPVPNVSVVVRADVSPNNDFSRMTEEGIERYMTALRMHKARVRGWQHVSHRRVWIAHRPGVEITGRRTVGRQQLTEVIRQVYREGKLYAIGLTWWGDNVKRASAAMVKLSLSFKFVEPRPAPETQPKPEPPKGD